MNTTRYVRSALTLMALSVLALACSSREQENQTQTGSVAERRTALKEHLVGIWTRPVRGAEGAIEGIRFDADGRCGLIGIHTANGLRWLVRGDSVVMTTNTDRYAEPTESRLPVQLVGSDSLVLWSEADYLAGTYKRSPGVAYRMSGTVTYAIRMAVSTDAAVFLELREPGPEGSGKLIASQVMPSEGNQVPIPFYLYYADFDTENLEHGELYCTIVDNGVPRFTLLAGYSSPLGADIEGIELWVDPVGSGL